MLLFAAVWHVIPRGEDFIAVINLNILYGVLLACVLCTWSKTV